MFPWYAIHVRSRQEKCVHRVLSGKGYETFLPLYRVERRWSSARRTFELPLFPGYVFGQFDADCRLPILTTPGVLSIVGFGGVPAPLEQSEMDAIQTVLAAGYPATPSQYLQAGDRVRIEDGPLAGVEGILISTKTQQRLIISISMLKRSVAVECDRETVQRLNRVSEPAPANSVNKPPVRVGSVSNSTDARATQVR